MDCKQVDERQLIEQAEKYVSGQLNPELQDRFEIHLLECLDCLAKVETLSTVCASLAERSHEVRQFSGKGAPHLRLVWSAVVASLAVVSILGLYYLRLGVQHEPGKSAPGAVTVSPVPPRDGSSEGTKGSNAVAKVPSSKQQSAPEQQQGTQVPPNEHRDQTQAQAALPNPSTGETIPIQNTPPRKTIAAQASDHNQKSPRSMSEEEAVELYRVGSVQAPAYTFAGFTAGAHPPRSKQEIDTMTSAGVPVATGRVLFQQAMAAYVEGDYAKASDILESARSAEPNAADVNFYLGICRLVEGHPADSIPVLKAALSSPPSPLTQPAHFYLAKAYVQMQQFAEAEHEMQEAAAMPGRLRAEARALLARIQALRKSINPTNE